MQRQVPLQVLPSALSLACDAFSQLYNTTAWVSGPKLVLHMHIRWFIEVFRNKGLIANIEQSLTYKKKNQKTKQTKNPTDIQIILEKIKQ